MSKPNLSFAERLEEMAGYMDSVAWRSQLQLFAAELRELAVEIARGGDPQYGPSFFNLQNWAARLAPPKEKR